MESSNNSIDKSVINGANLMRQQSITISPELFEKLYLSPQNAVKGGLRNTFANPTPLYFQSSSFVYTVSILYMY
jgi:hypothetical protein